MAGDGHPTKANASLLVNLLPEIGTGGLVLRSSRDTLPVCNCLPNLCKEQSLTPAGSSSGTTFPSPLCTGGSSGHGAAIRPDTDGGPVLLPRIKLVCTIHPMYRLCPRSASSWPMSPQKRAILAGLVISAVAFGMILSLARLH